MQPPIAQIEFKISKSWRRGEVDTMFSVEQRSVPVGQVRSRNSTWTLSELIRNGLSQFKSPPKTTNLEPI